MGTLTLILSQSTMGAVFSNVDGCCCGEPDKETPVVGNNIATTSNPTIKVVETQPPPIPASQPPQESQQSEISEEPQKPETPLPHVAPLLKILDHAPYYF